MAVSWSSTALFAAAPTRNASLLLKRTIPVSPSRLISSRVTFGMPSLVTYRIGLGCGHPLAEGEAVEGGLVVAVTVVVAPLLAVGLPVGVGVCWAPPQGVAIPMKNAMAEQNATPPTRSGRGWRGRRKVRGIK